MRSAPFAIGFALMVAFVSGWGGAATTPRWDVFALIAAVLFFTPPGRMTQAHWLGLTIATWLLLTLAWTVSPLDGTDSAIKLICVAVAFAWGAALLDLVPFIRGAALGVTVSSLIAIAQWYGWHPVEQYGEPSGLFYSQNRLAEVALIVFAAALALRQWWFIPGIVPALVLPYERAVWIGAAIVLAIWGWQRADGFCRFVLAASAGWIVVGLAMTASLWRTSQFGFEGIAERLAIWSFVVHHLSVFGHGLGAFVNDGPLLAWPVSPGSHIDYVSRAEHPHNEWLWLAYEGGAVAVALAVGFSVAVWRACDDGLRLVLVALFIVSCLAMPFHDPATIGVAVVCAGFGVGARRRIRLSDDIRGSPLRAWVEGGRGRGGEHVGACDGGEALPVPAAVS